MDVNEMLPRVRSFQVNCVPFLRTGTQMGYANAKKVRTLSGLLVHINRSWAELFRIRPEIGLRTPADQVRPVPRPSGFSRRQGQRGAKHRQTFLLCFEGDLYPRSVYVPFLYWKR